MGVGYVPLITAASRGSVLEAVTNGRDREWLERQTLEPIGNPRSRYI